MPSCEILSVGTELLLGQILNTNAQYLSQELATLGISCYYQTTVGDNKLRLIASIKEALGRADVLLMTGGLGPTADDLTTECLAEAFGVGLVFDQEQMDRIEAFFKTRGYPMPQSNRKQAYRPQGSQVLPNPRGTAPGALWQIEPELLHALGIADTAAGKVVMTFPGVPAEMKAMWQETAKPFLRQAFPEMAFWSVDLKHYGIGESTLAEKYDHLLKLSNPTVAPYAGQGECRLRVTASAATQAEAQALAQPIVNEISSASGELLYGRDDDTLEAVIGRLLTDSGLHISVAESCTGGLVSKRLTDVPGSSAYTDLNIITYDNDVKERVLGVAHETLVQHGAVSEQCAAEMAQGMLKIARSDLAVAVTGIAGPGGGTPEKPVGLVYVALAHEGGTPVHKLTLPSHISRSEIRFRSASEALNMVRLFLLSGGYQNRKR